jgi:hypothetical protein
MTAIMMIGCGSGGTTDLGEIRRENRQNQNMSEDNDEY